MKLFQSRVVWGTLLIVLGILLFLQAIGVLPSANLIWPILFGVVGLVFLYSYLTDRTHWWPIIPGFALLGLAALMLWDEFAPEPLKDWGAALFMGGLGLAFWFVYLTGRENWWAVIPGGVLLTLALVIGLSSVLEGEAVGGVFFLGMGLTFGLLAFLPTPEGRMKWALIPAVVLLVMGLLTTVAVADLLKYVGPVALILVGLYAILRAFVPRRGAGQE